jgi:hypothetical protein
MTNARNLADVGRIEGLSFIERDNAIINGAFDIWQRGTSSTASAYGTADRWAHFYVGGTVTTSRQSFSVGEKLGNNAPKYFLRQEVTGQSAGNFAAIQQRIESVSSYSGETITVLGWARRASGSGNPLVRLTQHFGTGGSPSSDVEITGKSLSLSSSWSPFALTFDIPSITGKTVGTDINDYLNLLFTVSELTVGIDYWGIHIRKGTHTVDVINSYTAPDIVSELIKCQRYGRALDIYTRFAGAWQSGTETAELSFSVEMRANPTLSGVSSYTIDGVTATASGITPTLSTKSIRFSITNSNGLAAANGFILRPNQNGFLDAEL